MKKMLYLSSALVVLGNVSIVNAAGNIICCSFNDGSLNCGDTIRECCRGFYRCLGMSDEESADERKKPDSGVEVQHMPSRGDIKTIWDIGGINSHKEGENGLVINLKNLESLYTVLWLDKKNRHILELFTGGIILSDVSLVPGWAFNSDENGKFKSLLQSLKKARSFRLEVKEESGAKWNSQRRGSLQGAKTLGREIYNTIQYFEQLEELDLSGCELVNADFEEILEKYSKEIGGLERRLERLKSIKLRHNDHLGCREEGEVFVFTFDEDENLNSVLVKAQQKKEQPLIITIKGRAKTGYSIDSQETHSPMAGLVDTDSQLMVSAMASVDNFQDLMTRSVEEKRAFLMGGSIGNVLFGVEAFDSLKSGNVRVVLRNIYLDKTEEQLESYYKILFKIENIKQLEKMLDQLQELAIEAGNSMIVNDINRFRTAYLPLTERQQLKAQIYEFKKIMMNRGKYKQDAMNALNLDDCQIILESEIKRDCDSFHMLLQENIYPSLNLGVGDFNFRMLMKTCFDTLLQNDVEKGRMYKIVLSYVKMQEIEQRAAKMPEYLDYMRKTYAPKAVELFQDTVDKRNPVEIEEVFKRYRKTSDCPF